jgi:transcriptional regulator with XRE-family HTH domain
MSTGFEKQLASIKTDNNKIALAIKAARLSMGLSRKDAAAKCGCTPKAIERLENQRMNVSQARLRHLISKMEMSWETFQDILINPQKHIATAVAEAHVDRTLKRKPRRNEYKTITKEARVIRSLRKQKSLSQSDACRLCGYGPQGFSFIEAGRVELTEKKIIHILKSFGCSKKEFQALMESSVLPDEVIEETSQLLHKLNHHSLILILNLVKELIQTGSSNHE